MAIGAAVEEGEWSRRAARRGSPRASRRITAGLPIHHARGGRPLTLSSRNDRVGQLATTRRRSAPRRCGRRGARHVAGARARRRRHLGMKPLASPYSAATRSTSRFGPSCASGSTAHCIELTIGRARAAQRCRRRWPPPSRSRSGRASRRVVTIWKCLLVLASAASAIVQRLRGRRHVLAGGDEARVEAHVRQRVDEARARGGIRPWCSIASRPCGPTRRRRAVVAQVAVPAVDGHVTRGRGRRARSCPGPATRPP